MNFKYKIITKILDVRLASIMPFLVSKEHMGFVKGRNIQDCTCLSSEVVNVLDNKHKHGNLVLKVDIMKAFDTISWDFNYLGILIFKWRPIAIHLSPISDKILARLSAFRQIFIPILTV